MVSMSIPKVGYFWGKKEENPGAGQHHRNIQLVRSGMRLIAKVGYFGVKSGQRQGPCNVGTSGTLAPERAINQASLSFLASRDHQLQAGASLRCLFMQEQILYPQSSRPSAYRWGIQ